MSLGTGWRRNGDVYGLSRFDGAGACARIAEAGDPTETRARGRLVIPVTGGDAPVSARACRLSIDIARGVDMPHASVIKLVRRHAGDLARFGRVGFELQPIAPRGGEQTREYALLNETYATPLIPIARVVTAPRAGQAPARTSRDSRAFSICRPNVRLVSAQGRQTSYACLPATPEKDMYGPLTRIGDSEHSDFCEPH